jgi:two-component system, cell cycle sensor histidine kinase and response regulator CckA
MRDRTARGMNIAKGVLGELDLDVVLKRVLQAARELTGAAYAAFGVLGEPESDSEARVEFERFITAGVDEETRAAIGAPPRGLGVLGELIRDSEPLRLADIGRHPHSCGFPGGHPDMHTFLGVPVFVEDRPFGSLYLTEKADGAQFTDADQEAVATLAQIAGVAIENAQLYTGARDRREELERTVTALEATTQVTRAIGDETDVGVVLELIAKRGRALVSARVLLIELCQGDELLIAAGAGEVPEGLLGRRMPLPGTFAEQAVDTRGGARVEDEVSRARFNEVGVGRLSVRATAGLVVPLVFRDRAYGALLAIDRLEDGPAFSAEDQRLLEAFATSAATAVAVAHTVAVDIERLASVVRSSPDAIVTIDEHGVITSWNPGAEEIYGYTAAETVGRPGSEVSALVVPPGSEEEVSILPRVLAGEVVKHHETKRVRKDGTGVEISLSVAAIRDSYGRLTGVASVGRDITEQKRTQRILSQTERLESIGQLAGGVAHDMNNLLTIILNHADFALENLDEDDPAGREIHAARGAAERAATLVRQLLLFAREGTGNVQVLDTDAIVGELEKMLARTLGEHIALRTELAQGAWPIEADRTQVEQVVMNLAVNARDAMTEGGTLTISTTNVTLDEDTLRTHAGPAQPGPYLCLAVSDTGVGMTPEVIAKAFEPFFTTKPTGSGTGLGLATVYGILRRARGHVQIYSEPGRGTAIKTYWPISQRAETAAAGESPERSSSHTPAGETILLVEDEDALRSLAVRILEPAGYTVLVAGLPSEALELAARHGDGVDLLLTDLVMPEMSGAKLAAQLTSARPGLRVIYTSGYVAQPGELPDGAAFVSKPYTRAGLLAAVGAALQ